MHISKKVQKFVGRGRRPGEDDGDDETNLGHATRPRNQASIPPHRAK